MWTIVWRELTYLCHQKWDLSLVTIAPLAMIILFSSMFYAGKAEHLPIAIIDQDNSVLSHTIERHLQLNHAVDVVLITDRLQDVEQLLNRTEVWGYVHIPSGAEQRLVKAQDAQIAVVFNQSFFSIGNTISSAMLVSSLRAIVEFGREDYFVKKLPHLNTPKPHVKISTLYNPNLSYEFFLEPFLVPAILHLLLCCCVAFSIGQEFKRQTVSAWLAKSNVFSALWGKVLVYVIIFLGWTGLWLFWLIVIRGWFVAGSLAILLFSQFLFYLAYALIAAVIILASRNLSKTFGLIAVYSGSSLSFAGVTLPIDNAPLFTKIWSNIIPYTPYVKIQTQQWVIGSPISTSLTPLAILILFVFLFGVCATWLTYVVKRANL